MYPTLFEYGPIHLTSFGVMMVAGFLVGSWMNARAFAERGLRPEIAWDLMTWAMVGGVLGSKLWFVAEQVARHPGAAAGLLEPGGPLLSLGGLTWYGGLVGGAAAGILGAHRAGITPLTVANLVAPSLAVGQALGRVGCFLVGDDYGRETTLPWGIAFPQGIDPIDVPVHPTQLYETAWLGLCGAWLWRRRNRSPLLIAEYLILAGLGRFAIELVRRNPNLVGGLSNAQLVAIACLGAGGLFLLRARVKQEAA